jgi:hypothetical protein
MLKTRGAEIKNLKSSLPGAFFITAIFKKTGVKFISSINL